MTTPHNPSALDAGLRQRTRAAILALAITLPTITAAFVVPATLFCRILSRAEIVVAIAIATLLCGLSLLAAAKIRGKTHPKHSAGIALNLSGVLTLMAGALWPLVANLTGGTRLLIVVIGAAAVAISVRIITPRTS